MSDAVVDRLAATTLDLLLQAVQIGAESATCASRLQRKREREKCGRTWLSLRERSHSSSFMPMRSSLLPRPRPFDALPFAPAPEMTGDAESWSPSPTEDAADGPAAAAVGAATATEMDGSEAEVLDCEVEVEVVGGGALECEACGKKAWSTAAAG